MTTDLTEMVEWLRSTVTGDLEAAKGADGVTYWIDSDGSGSIGDHFERHEPADTIARCEAELAIIDEHTTPDPRLPEWACGVGCRDKDMNTQATPCTTIRRLASGYRHRPGWKEGWAP